MRFLLDEMYPASIAEGLRARDHDAVAVVERMELRNTPDADLFALAQAEKRAVVTENVGDFVVLANAYDGRGDAHYGIIFVHARRYQRVRPKTIGAMVTALDALASAVSGEQATSLRHWL